MKTIKKLLALILALTIFCTTASFAVNENDSEFGDELTKEQYDFIYNESNYEMPFVGGVVIVALKKGVAVDDVDFSEFDVRGIDILNSEIYELGESENLLLTLNLRNYGRKIVLEVIDILKTNTKVLYAEPCYSVNYASEAGCNGATVISSDSGRVIGDINNDRYINNADIIILARYIVRLTSLTYTQLRCADINRDNYINNADLVLLAKKVVGL